MSEPAQTSRKKQEYEHTLGSSDSSVAQFDHKHRTLFDTVQHFLHGNPTMVPVIVLVFSIVIFGFVAGPKFFSPFNQIGRASCRERV